MPVYPGASLSPCLYMWGQDWLGGTPEWHFAAFEYGDSATGLYPTLNRQYANGEGRWLSPNPDNAGADPRNPQTWNMYAYAGNNPATNVDPDGEDYYLLGGEVCNDDPTQCDAQGYLLDANGNRQVIGDQQVLNGQVSFTVGANGVETINGFQAQFFNNTPTSIDVNGTMGSPAAAVGANLLFGTYNSVADNPWATGLTEFVMGKDYIAMPHLSGGEGKAAYSGLALAILVPFITDDGTGRVHGDLSVEELSKLSTDTLEHLADRLDNSLKRHMVNLVNRGNQAGHGDRWAQEAQVLQKIEKILSERGR